MVEFLAVRRESLARSGLALIVLMTALDTSIVNASLPTLARTFGASFSAAQWIVLASLLAVTSLSVSAGRLGDIVGRRRLLLAAVATFTVASTACAMAPSLAWLIAARAVLGVCAGTMAALAYAVASELPDARSGRMMGQFASVSAIGTTLGPVLAGLLSHAWPGAVFFVNVPIGAAALLLALRYLPAAASPRQSLASFDVAGAAILAMTLAAYALSMTPHAGGWGTSQRWWLLSALAGGAAFAIVESRVASPLMPMATFRDLRLLVGLASSALVAAVMMTTLIVGPFYLSSGLGLAAGQVGVVLSIGPAAAAVAAALAGRLLQRIGVVSMMMRGLAAMAAGATALVALSPLLGTPGYVLPLVLMTAGYALFQTGNNTAVLAGADGSRRGAVAGLLNLSRNFGLIFGASVMGAVFQRASGAGPLASADRAAVAMGMRTTFAVALALIAFAVVLLRCGLAGRRHRTSSIVSVTPTNVNQHS